MYSFYLRNCSELYNRCFSLIPKQAFFLDFMYLKMSHVCHGLYKIKYSDIHVTCMYVNVDLSIIVIVNIDVLTLLRNGSFGLVLFDVLQKHIYFIRLQVCITIISPYALENDECVVKFSKQNCRLIINNVYFHLEVIFPIDHNI